jgi:septation ring formation regulator EzrA
MKEKEKYKAEIEERLQKFDAALNEIKMKQEQAKGNLTEINIDELTEKRNKCRDKLSELEKTDESTWGKLKLEFDEMFSDIDKDMRIAMGYFK